MNRNEIIETLHEFIDQVEKLRSVFQELGPRVGEQKYFFLKSIIDEFLDINLPKEKDYLNKKLSEDLVVKEVAIPTPTTKFWNSYGSIITDFFNELINDLENDNYELRHQEYIICDILNKYLEKLNGEVTVAYTSNINYGEKRYLAWKASILNYFEINLPKEIQNLKAVCLRDKVSSGSLQVVDDFWGKYHIKIESYLKSLIKEIETNRYDFNDPIERSNKEKEIRVSEIKKLGKKLFISHAQKDIELARTLINFLENAIGVDTSEIYCSFVDSHGVPSKDNFIEYMRSQVTEPDLTIILLTPSYLKCELCLCELGASMAKSKELFPFIVPPVLNEDIKLIHIDTPKYNLAAKIDFAKLIKLLHDKPYVTPPSIDEWNKKSVELYEVIKNAIAHIYVPTNFKNPSEKGLADLEMFTKQLDMLGLDISKLYKDYKVLSQILKN